MRTTSVKSRASSEITIMIFDISFLEKTQVTHDFKFKKIITLETISRQNIFSYSPFDNHKLNVEKVMQ